jgi:hypothetical protein
MKTLAKILLGALLGFGLLQAAAFEKVANSPSVKLTLVSEKPLGVGVNTIKVILPDGKLEGAKVNVKVFMPAMPGMPAMQSVSEAKDLSNGMYETQVNLSMRGTWQVHIFITPKEGRKIRVKTSINL